MLTTTRKTAAAIGLTAALCLTLPLGTANADPDVANTGTPRPAVQGSFLPDANDIIGVGADTTQYVMNSAAQTYSFTGGTFRDVRLVSYDAIDPATSQPGGVITAVDPDQHLDAAGVPVVNGDESTLLRPDGSTSGVGALLTNPDVDFARSTVSRPHASLYHIPVLRDGLSYVVDRSAGADIRNLDATELAAIYRCIDARGYHPKLPPAGSGTRAFFLAQLGMTEIQVGPCVDPNVRQNDESSVVGDPLALMPFSVARYGVDPASPANPPSSTVDIAATTTTAGVFYTEQTLYNVVRKADYDAAGSSLPAIFGVGGYLCARLNSGIHRQGFKVAAGFGSECGRI